MKGFFKTFGKGILGVILSPFVLVFFLLYFVYCFALYLYQAVKWVVIFFSGKDYAAKLPEEIAAEEKMTNKIYDPITKKFMDKEEYENRNKPAETTTTTTTTTNNNNKSIVYQQNIIVSDQKDIDPAKLMNSFIEETNNSESAQLEHQEEVNEISMAEEDKQNESN